jgi:tRNA A-37 threonylcarbamoyl transferase component Bud32
VFFDVSEWEKKRESEWQERKRKEMEGGAEDRAKNKLTKADMVSQLDAKAKASRTLVESRLIRTSLSDDLAGPIPTEEAGKEGPK